MGIPEEQTYTEKKKKEIIWRQIFNIFDDDGEGSLTHAELYDLLKRADGTIKDEVVNVIIHELDKDGGGTVDFEEFFEYAEDRVQEFPDIKRDLGRYFRSCRPGFTQPRSGGTRGRRGGK